MLFTVASGIMLYTVGPQYNAAVGPHYNVITFDHHYNAIITVYHHYITS